MRDELMEDDRTRIKMKWKETLQASPAFYTINGAKNEFCLYFAKAVWKIVPGAVDWLKGAKGKELSLIRKMFTWLEGSN